MAEPLTRIPAGVMDLIRQSYDTREKVLDWMLALGVAGIMVWTFRDAVRGLIADSDDGDPNAGNAPPPVPSPLSDADQAFPYGAPGRDATVYNQPASRQYRMPVGPSSTRPPLSPSYAPSFMGGIDAA